MATKFGGLRPIRWIGTQRFHPRFAGHEPVRQATCLPIVTAEHPWIEGIRCSLPSPTECVAA